MGVARADLRADCASCVGLCCVVPAFARSADFAADKPAGTPCPNLGADSRCGIHTELRRSGYAGCVVYDCFGAGQWITREVLGPDGSRTDPRLATLFPAVRDLHELLAHLAEAQTWDAAAALRPALADAEAEVRAARARAPEVDLDALRAEVSALLLAAGEKVRGPERAAGRPRPGADLRHANLRGAMLLEARLRGADLRAANLRGALLVGADLRSADLREADVIGADLRAADLRGADLRGALFLTAAQLESARGDTTTRLPAPLTHPGHWA
ncbi:pentapeptide repeat-containing protein [Actinokineospora pegani]|uniref:pentapeptide repeat-containing protein n=1 Tax=Actinokineospora pegani TaxID=2654637 RepID=UPI0018D2C3C2|nr:pentapeptide repeat-containing protein [Actinokineospora pegani]